MTSSNGNFIAFQTMILMFKHRILPLLAGITAALLTLALLEEWMAHFGPQDWRVDSRDPQEARKQFLALPDAVRYLQLLFYAFSAFMGGLVATRVSPVSAIKPAFIIGLALTIAGITNPDPIWFKVVSSFIYLPFSLLGFYTIKRTRPSAS